MIIVGSHLDEIARLLHLLRTNFLLKDLDDLHFFLGIQCCCTSSSLMLSQQKYIVDLLKKTNMNNCKPMSSPMFASTKLSAFDSISMDDPTLYRSVVGNLQYLLITRPNLSFVVNRVCQFMYAPYLTHWQAVKQILYYLQHTMDHCLTISSSPSSVLVAFSNANWTDCPNDRKSIGCYCVFYGNNLIS